MIIRGGEYGASSLRIYTKAETLKCHCMNMQNFSIGMGLNSQVEFWLLMVRLNSVWNCRVVLNFKTGWVRLTLGVKSLDWILKCNNHVGFGDWISYVWVLEEFLLGVPCKYGYGAQKKNHFIVRGGELFYRY